MGDEYGTRNSLFVISCHLSFESQVFLRGEVWLKLEARNLQKFACGAVRILPLGQESPWNGRILHLSPSHLDSFLKETATKTQTSSLNRTGGHVKQPGVPRGKKGLIAGAPASEIPSHANEQGSLTLLQGGALPPIRCIVHEGERNVFDKIQRALRIIIKKKNIGSQMFMRARPAMGVYCGNILPAPVDFDTTGGVVLGACAFNKHPDDSERAGPRITLREMLTQEKSRGGGRLHPPHPPSFLPQIIPKLLIWDGTLLCNREIMVCWFPGADITNYHKRVAQDQKSKILVSAGLVPPEVSGENLFCASPLASGHLQTVLGVGW